MDSESRTGELTALIDRFLLLRQEGLSMSVDQLCKDAPHLAEAVARELQALGDMDRLLNTDETDSAGETVSSTSLGKRHGQASASSSYQIERLHAHGGCSEVYIAHDKQLNRKVAIKFLRPDTEHLDVYRIRLQREADLTSRLDHPGVVSIHSKGEDARGLPFYTMRFVEGQSMGAVIDEFHEANNADRNLFFSPAARRLLNHFCDVCQTIAFAHNKRVVHRDLKPANIVIGSFGETYVIDWGLARHLDSKEPDSTEGAGPVTGQGVDDTVDTPRLTRLGSAMGSPAFMSPEQAVGSGSVGVASDIFNLGATLYAILTGSPPYANPSLVRTLKDAEQASFQRPRAGKAVVPGKLDAICCKAMSPNPGDRYSSADQLASDVEHFLADEPVSAMKDSWIERSRRWCKRRRTMVTTAITSGVVALVLLGIGNAILLDNNLELARRESEANYLRGETRNALDEANANLYSQKIALAHAEWLKNNPFRALQILNECPRDLRKWEWHHLYWLVTRHKPFQQTSGNGESIRGIAISSDSRIVAYGDSGGTICLWDLEKDSVVRRFKENIEVWGLAFSPDDSRIAVSGVAYTNREPQSAIRILDLDSGERIAGRTSKSGGFTNVEYSRDGKRIATGSANGGIRIRDADTLVPVVRVNDLSQATNDVSFIDDTYRFVSGGADGIIRTWDEQGNLTSEQSGHPAGITDLACNATMVVTTGNDKLVKIWQRKKGDADASRFVDSESTILVGHTDKVQSVGISPDGKFIASAGLDRNVRIWAAGTGEEIAVIRQHSSHIHCVRFDPVGERLFSSGDDNCVNSWKLDSLTEMIPHGHSVAFGNRGAESLLAASFNQLEVWDAVNRRPVSRTTDHPAQLNSIVSSRNRDLVAGLYANGDVALWNSENASRLRLLQDSSSPVYAAVFSPDGSRLFIGHHDGEIVVWNMDDGSTSSTRSATRSIFRMAITNDGNQLLTGHRDGSMEIWSLPEMVSTQKIQMHSGILLDMAVHPTRDEVSTTGKNGDISVWDIKTGEQKVRMEVGESWLNCLCYTPDGQRLVSGSEHTVTFWDAEEGSEVVSFSVDRCVHSMAFSSDGKYFAIGGEDPRIRIWEGPSFR